MKTFLFVSVVLLIIPITTFAGISYSYSGTWQELDLGLPDHWGNQFEGRITSIYSDDIYDSDPEILLFNNGMQDLGSGLSYTEYTGTIYDSFFDVFFDFDIPEPGKGSWIDMYSADTVFTLTGTTIDSSGKYLLKITGDGTIDGYSENPDIVSGLYYYYGEINGNITVCLVPAPGALMLGALGVGLVGVIRRRLA
jgi:hypothetical protein